MALEAEIGARFDWSDGVPIVTCQRYELVTLSPATIHAERSFQGPDALLHLAGLAAGLDSLVLGEPEVLGQVRRALSAGSTALRRLVVPAIAAARILRREADFQAHAGFALDIALDHAGVAGPGTLLVVGGGAMGRRVAERSVRLGFHTTVVARRPPPPVHGVHYQPFSNLASLAPTHVLVSCLGRMAPALGEPDLPRVLRLAVDLGTPRNLGELSVPVVVLADLLYRKPEEERRRQLTQRLRAILADQIALARPGSPLAALREEVERIRQRELVRSLRLHPELPPEKLDAITRSLVNQIFHRPSQRLRNSDDLHLAQAVVALFRPRHSEESSDSQ